MSRPAVHIVFEDDIRVYEPGEMLVGEYSLAAIQPSEVKAIELSVLWYSEGKGDEDLAVHVFERREPAGGNYVDLAHPFRFATRLPNSPLSYDGVILKICWCVRVRVFFVRGKELYEEQPFHLGTVPRPELVPP